MKRRGQIKSRMLPIRFDGPPPASGAELLNGERRAGEVLSGREGQAIALVRLDRVVEGELTAEGRGVRTERPPWIGDAANPPN
jgi:folate-binding Fe-S cluster repair protein YgfZ